MLFAAGFSSESVFSFDAESSVDTFALKPGGNKLLMSVLNDNLFSTLSKLSVLLLGVISVVVVVINFDNL